MTRERSIERIALLLLLPLAGCYETFVVDDPDGSPPPWDAGPSRDSGVFVPPPGKCLEPSGVDLLFVVDNSNSMAEEQASLAAEIPALVRALVDPPDEDADGNPDWLPIRDLSVGVVTTDMGVGGFTVPTCTDGDFGDDGLLRTEGNTAVDGCSASYPRFARYTPGAATPEEVAFDVSCVTQAGLGGCGFEQPLEATLKALSPAAPTAATGPGYVPPTFFRGTRGHADGANAGFVRDDTLLAVVIVTDEEDCSASDPNLFDPTSVTYGATDLNLRCFAHAESAVHPIERYVAGLTALRARRPDLLALGVVAGIPTDLALASPSDADYARILADERMTERVDPTMPNRLEPSCNVPGRGVAFPPRRLVSVAHGLGRGRSSVQSICQEDFAPAAAAFARLFGRRACTRFDE